MKFKPIDINLDKKTYNIRALPEDRDRFYELMRSGALNKVTNHSPLLDDYQVAVPVLYLNSMVSLVMRMC